MASKITKIVANFETQLASTIGVASTTGSLKFPVLDDDGVQLADGKYVMCVDIGNSKEEHLIFDLVGLTGAMTNIVSISKNGTETAGAVRQHRSGAKVSLTDYANLLYISRVLTGQVGLDGANPLVYDLAPTFNNVLQVVTKGYVDAQGSIILANILGGNNTFTGNTVFSGSVAFQASPTIPDATVANQPVTLSQLMSAILGGVSADWDYVSVSYFPNGLLRTVHDNVAGITYVLQYDSNKNLSSIYNGSKRFFINRSNDKFISSTM